MTSRIKRDKRGQPIRNAAGEIIRTKPNTRTGEMTAPECIHEFISWHGSRGECQECGANIAPILTVPSPIRKIPAPL